MLYVPTEKKGEVISVHVGQAGLQIGNACWELYCLEHGISPDGIPTNLMGSLSSFFQESSSGKFIPRAIFADLESSVVDEIKSGKYKRLYKPDCFISGPEDAANNYARAHYSIGKQFTRSMEDVLRHEAEATEGLQGFLTFHSLGGGTGSGFATLISEYMSVFYPKKSFLEVCIFPSQKLSTSVVEPYNAVLSTNAMMSNVDCVFLADNQAIYNLCSSNLEMDQPMYSHLNRVLTQAVSFLTLSLRFDGQLNADFVDFQTNLVPYPRIHFPIMSLSPISHHNAGQAITSLTRQCFDPQNRLALCDMENGYYIACCLLYRGDVVPKDVYTSIAQLKEKAILNFVKWSPAGFKIGINYQPQKIVQSSKNMDMAASSCFVSCFSNNTAVGQMWDIQIQKYVLMSSHKAFFHWYLQEGMEEGEFVEAQNNISTLVKDYIMLLRG